MRFLLALVFLLPALVQAQSEKSAGIPTLTSPVMDTANVISPDVKARLERNLRAVNERGVAQVQVLTIRSLLGEPLETFSLRVVDEWKLGDKDKDNGVLVFVVVHDRRSRIEVGRGLEGAIPDVIAKQIQADVMRPQFKRGDYGAGIENGVGELVALADKEYGGDLPKPKTRVNWGLWVPLLELAFVVFVIIMALSRGGRRRGRGYFYGGLGGAGWGGTSSGGWGGGSSWGGGGGSWGGGGGGFGGGGASDSW